MGLWQGASSARRWLRFFYLVISTASSQTFDWMGSKKVPLIYSRPIYTLNRVQRCHHQRRQITVLLIAWHITRPRLFNKLVRVSLLTFLLPLLQLLLYFIYIRFLHTKRTFSIFENSALILLSRYVPGLCFEVKSSGSLPTEINKILQKLEKKDERENKRTNVRIFWKLQGYGSYGAV